MEKKVRGAAEIVFESRNALDISQEALDELAQQIRDDLSTAGTTAVDVWAVAQTATGVGHTWIDALEVFLPSKDFLKDYAWTVVLDRLARFMRARRTSQHGLSRPRIIVVHETADGTVISVKRLNNETELLDELGPDADPRHGQIRLQPPRHVQSEDRSAEPNDERP